MHQMNAHGFTHVYQLFFFESCCIMSDLFGWATKSSKNILIQKFYDNLVISILSGYSLNPFGEIISGYQDPFMSTTRMWINLTYEFQAPLLEWTIDMYWLQG